MYVHVYAVCVSCMHVHLEEEDEGMYMHMHTGMCMQMHVHLEEEDEGLRCGDGGVGFVIGITNDGEEHNGAEEALGHDQWHLGDAWMCICMRMTRRGQRCGRGIGP